MRPRFWAGERESAGLTSIYRGPILLTYDRRFNTIDPGDLPALSAGALHSVAVDGNGALRPWILCDCRTVDGRSVRLCDFASAGADGSPYQSWLKVEHAVVTPFTWVNPLRSGRATD
jgi:uncharacterized protein